jgi:hypothetical protein
MFQVFDSELDDVELAIQWENDKIWRDNATQPHRAKYYVGIALIFDPLTLDSTHLRPVQNREFGLVRFV